MNILQDIFVYFTRYVTPDVVDRFFTKASGDDDYNQLRTMARTAATGRFPELTDYIFGVQEESVTRRIGQVKGAYLFVDYGGITSSEDLRNVKSDDFSLAVTVARPMSSAALDMADELLVSDRLLRIIAASGTTCVPMAQTPSFDGCSLRMTSRRSMPASSPTATAGP